MFTFFKKKPTRQENSVPEHSVPTKQKDTGKAQNQKIQNERHHAAALSKPASGLLGHITKLFQQQKPNTAALLKDIETALLLADTGVSVTKKLITQLEQYCTQQKRADPEAILPYFEQLLINLLKKAEQPLHIPEPDTANHIPFVILIIGVNGVGKTTTIAKLAKRLQEQNKKVILAAGDTFRAAATEQLTQWAEQHQIPIVAQQQNADSAAVIYDCITSAIARKMDVVIADTAGRLHNKEHLMQELGKIIRVMQKINPVIPQEVLLVLDATTGQNAIQQVHTFNQLAKVSGIVLTKFDSTAKGGILLHLAEIGSIPIKLVGTGEAAEDLMDFHSESFVRNLFADSGLQAQ